MKRSGARGNFRSRRVFVPVFAVDRELVQHVAQSFDMHEPVLDSDVQDLHEFATALVRFHGERPEPLIDRLAQASVVALDLLTHRPVLGLVARQPSADRIDSESKEFVELRRKGSRVEKTAVEEVPLERLEMAEIKNDAMA